MPSNTALIIGASRGLGLGLAREYARQGWRVIGTVRSSSPEDGFSALVAEMGDMVVVETLDVTSADQIAS